VMFVRVLLRKSRRSSGVCLTSFDHLDCGMKVSTDAGYRGAGQLLTAGGSESAVRPQNARFEIWKDKGNLIDYHTDLEKDTIVRNELGKRGRTDVATMVSREQLGSFK